MDNDTQITCARQAKRSTFVLLVCRLVAGLLFVAIGTSVASGSQHRKILQSSGAWLAVRTANYFGDIATSNGGSHRVAMILPDNSKHFVIALFGGLSVSKGSITAIQFSFDTGKAFLMTGRSPDDNIIVTRIPNDLVAPWTHALTAGTTMVVEIKGPNGSTWNFSLAGSSPTISSMAQAIEQAGITGLPEPWTMTEFDAQDGSAPGVTPNPDNKMPALPESRPSRGYIGIEYETMTPVLANAFGVGNSLDASQGVVITDVLPNSPAKIAGLRAGDIVIAFGSHPIDNLAALRSRIRGEQIGATIHLKIIRNHKVKEVSVVCGRHPHHGVS